MPMTPFRLDLELRSPLAGGELPTLDAVLLGELVRLNPDKDPGRDPKAARNALGWDGKQNDNAVLKFTNGGIPHASALMFDARGEQNSAVKITGRRRELREIAPLELHVKKMNGVFLASGDEYKNSDINRFACRSIETAHFCGIGNLAEIRRILSFWQGVGAQWRNGWGELTGGEGEGWYLTELTDLSPDEEKRWGLLDENGAPVRPLPVALFRKRGGADEFPVRYRRVAPPYWPPSAPRVAAVTPNEHGGFPLSPPPRPSAEKAESPAMDPMKFLLEQFARRMRPASELRAAEKNGGTMAALRQAIEPQDYQHREGKNNTRLGGSLFIAAGATAKLFSNALPKGECADGFQSAGPLARGFAEWQKIVYQAAMTETDGLCVVIQFPPKKALAPEDLHVFSGRSDNAALSGEYSGWFSRATIRRIVEIAESAGLTLSKLKSVRDAETVRRNLSDAKSAQWVGRERKRRKIDEDDCPDPRELVDDWMERERKNMKLSEDDMFDLRDWLADMSDAGWKVLAAAPCFRKKEAGE